MLKLVGRLRNGFKSRRGRQISRELSTVIRKGFAKGFAFLVYNTFFIRHDTLKQLLWIDDEIIQLCKWLNERRDMATSAKLSSHRSWTISRISW
jgi:hypothetical protein